MKKIFLIISLFSLSLFSCNKNERIVYEEKPAIYFLQSLDEYSGEIKDSVNYTFTMTTESFDTVLLRVNLLGSIKEDKYFKLKVAPESSAIEGTHYKPLEDKYLMAAVSVKIMIPIYVLQQPDLDTEFKSLIIDIVADDTFDIGYEENYRTRVFITNQVIKPSYWDDFLILYFGEYSKVKHEICIDQIMNHDFPIEADDNFDYGYYMNMGRKASLYFRLNVVEDENGNIIETWDPF